jgi:uncharacterized protein (TIGR01777 family)
MRAVQVVISGVTGLIGRALARSLQADGHRVIGLSRSPGSAREDGSPRQDGGPELVAWDPARGVLDPGALAGTDVIVHLAGAGIGDHRWTDDYKRTVLESRTAGTALLASVAAGLDPLPRVFVSGSAVGYYGDTGDEELTEDSPAGDIFLSEICVAWEAAARPAAEAGIRTPRLRTGIVLSTDGGALPKLLPLFRAFVGGRLGSGKQWWSWISIDDEVGAIRHLIDHDDIDGPVNLTAPEPVTNADFTDELGSVLARPTVLPVPRFGPRLLLGRERADALLFVGQRALPTVLDAHGYEFRHPDLESALRSIFDR